MHVGRDMGLGRLSCICAAALCQVHVTQYDEPRLISVARSAVDAEVRGLKAKVKGTTPVQPVFVTIEIGGEVRGCRGSLQPRSTSLEEEISLAARGAAAHDPRYKPLQPSQLGNYKVTVTVVLRKELISTISGLGPEDGIVLQSAGKFGIVLPWEGKDPAIRLKWAYKKAGVREGSPAKIYRLVATRFRG